MLQPQKPKQKKKMSKTTWRKRLIGTWSWKRPFYSIGSIYILLLILTSCSVVNKLIFPAPPASYSEKKTGVFLLGNDKQQKVACLHLKGDSDKPTLLWSHGNAEDLGLVTPLLEYINGSLGYSILAYDYPGYGLSEGSPDEKGCYSNIQTAWGYLTDKQKLTPENIVIVGQSIGTGPSVWLAEKESSAGLVLISPFTSINRIPFGYNLFPVDRFPNIKRIKNIKTPLLILHGENDKVIKQAHGKALFAAYAVKPEDKTFINLKGVGHNDLVGEELFHESLREFLQNR